MNQFTSSIITELCRVLRHFASLFGCNSICGLTDLQSFEWTGSVTKMFLHIDMKDHKRSKIIIHHHKPSCRLFFSSISGLRVYNLKVFSVFIVFHCFSSFFALLGLLRLGSGLPIKSRRTRGVTLEPAPGS